MKSLDTALNLSLILLLVFLVSCILFIFTQYNTLRLIPAGVRELRPGFVWFQLVPIFNLYWVFVVVTRIADSISKHNASVAEDSILGISGYDAVESIGRRPTYKIGIAWSLLYVLYFGLNFFIELGNRRDMEILLPLVALAMIVCWIIYWVKLDRQKRKLKAKPADL